MRYRDPETGRTRVETLGAADAKTADTRLALALRLHKGVSRRREDIAGGAVRHRDADLTLPEAIGRYFRDNPQLRDGTVESYRAACDVFLAWCAATGLRTVRQLNRGRLLDFKSTRIKAGKRVPLAGGRRGEGAAGGQRSAFTINKELRAVSIALGWLHDAQIIRLSRDDIRIGLKRLKTDKVLRRDYLRADEIRALLAAANARDAVTFAMNRRGEKNVPRYAPIEPLIRFLLLSGCRVGEALTLTWAHVDLGGEKIEIPAPQTKTKHDRTIELSVCPSLLAWLKKHKGTSAERIFPDHTEGSLKSARRRLRVPFKWSYQGLRVTAATYLACMPSFGPVHESRQLGHSILVAQDFYIDRIKIAADVVTLEQAMGLDA